MGDLKNPSLPKVGGGNNGANAQNKKDSDLIFDVKIDTREEFPNFIDSGLISTRKLMETISDAFSQLLTDYVGCFITPYPNGGGFDVRLYFTNTGQDVTDDDGKLVRAKAFKDAPADGKSSGSKTLDTLNTIINMPKKKLYYISDAGKEFLSRFMVGGDPKNPNKVNWNNFVTEVTEHRGFNNCVYAVVFGLDLYRILSFIYGNKDENGEFYTYSVNIARQIDAMNYLLFINRVSNTKVNELSNELGYINRDAIPMVRATTGI